MVGRALIIERDEYTASQLQTLLGAAGVEASYCVSTMRAACMALGGQAYDIAIIPEPYAQHRIKVFRSLQPELSIILIYDGPGQKIPAPLLDQIQGIVTRQHLDSQLPILLEHIVASNQSRQIAPEPNSLSSTIFVETDSPGFSHQPDKSSSEGTPPLSSGPDKARWDPIIDLLAFFIPRIVFALMVLLAIIFITYLGIDMAGGTDFTDAVKGALPATISYVQSLLHGDLGTTTTPASNLRAIPVAEVLTQWLPRSLGLIAISMIFASILGISLGFMAARRGSERSLPIIIATIIGVSVPSFFAAFLLQWAVTSVTRLSGRTLLPVGGFGWDTHLILPVLVLAARPLAQITRITFTSVDNVLHQDYVRTAQSKGLPNYLVLGRHIMRNAAIPVLTTVGVSLRFAMTGLPIVELYFGWLGGGFLLLKGIAFGDENLTIALVLCFGLIFITVNFLLEVSYRFIDPRLKERPSYIATREKRGPWHSFQTSARELWDLLSDNAIVHWAKQHLQRPSPEPLHQVVGRSSRQLERDNSNEKVPNRRSAWRVALRNSPFLIGSFLVIILLFVILGGPYLAPNSPFTTQGLVKIDGQLTPPPFPPGEKYPWGTDALGRDIMSLILVGAKQTLTLAILAVTARMAVGIFLGAIAGWRQGSRLDRAIGGAAEIIAAYPTLLLTMIIILAIGIREGMMTFIIALCFVGWGETMQYVRSEVTGLRQQPFIESAIAIGARTPRIIGRHILPILFSSLISIAALEMGSVLMLLGELGFINIFIGGGALIELPTGVMLYSDVPEWGALLSNVRLMARSYPWTALYPMSAIFIAVLSFNLFSEGIRRMVARGYLVFDRLINRYTITLAMIGLAIFFWLRFNSGVLPIYRQQASEFKGDRALGYIEEFTAPDMEGRALGTAGMDQAAERIADEFEALGLQVGGEKNTYFQERNRIFEQLTTEPTLMIDDARTQPIFSQDFAPYPSASATMGERSGPVRLIALGREIIYTDGVWHPHYPELERIDLTQDIVLTLSDREAAVLDWRASGGLLVVAEDPDLLRRQYTIGGLTIQENSPRLWISEEMADRLLLGSGYTVESLKKKTSQLAPEEVFDLELKTRASMKVDGEVNEKWPVRHVIGYLPGTSGMEWCEICLDDQLIVVLAQYDSPPIGLDGKIIPAANDNASGLGLMLETIRILQKTDYQPFKSFVFVAYSGEGLDGGGFVNEADVKNFLQAKTGFLNFDVEAIVLLRGLGGENGERLEISAGGSLRLAEMFERAARQMGVDVVRRDDTIDIGVIYKESGSLNEGGQEAPVVRLFWEGWEEYTRLPADTMANLSASNLEEAGRALTMGLMILGREINY